MVSCTEHLGLMENKVAWSVSRAERQANCTRTCIEHYPLATAHGELLFKVITDLEQAVPGWFVKGQTVLIPKSPGTKAPEK